MQSFATPVSQTAEIVTSTESESEETVVSAQQQQQESTVSEAAVVQSDESGDVAEQPESMPVKAVESDEAGVVQAAVDPLDTSIETEHDVLVSSTVKDVVPQEPDTSPFDPEIHLLPHPDQTSYISMSELGFSDVDGAEERAATKPFPMLTIEGVRRIREELFSDRVLSNHLYSDTLNPSTIRGCCPDAAPFTYQFWTHPEVQKRINEAAGTDLTIVFD